MFELFLLYIFISIVVSLIQIKFIKAKKYTEPFLLEKSEFIKAGEYKEKRESLSILERIFELVIFIFWFFYGLKVLDINLSIVENQTLKDVIFVNIFILTNMIFALPVDFYIKFKLDKAFGFSTIDIKTYIIDTIKSVFISLIATSVIVSIVSLIINSFENWWFYGFMTIFSFIIVLNILYPTVIAPMFNKFNPLENENLKSEIDKLLLRVGFESNGIFVVDASKRDNRLNAYFGGFGKTKRVVLFDTLIEKLTTKELLAVLGHELGHFKHLDIFKNIAIIGCVLALLFYFFGNLELSSNILMALFLLTAQAFTFFLLPIINFMSRINEFRADEFGSALVSSVDLKSALIKLVNENRSFPFSHPIYIFFYYSHPPLEQRLSRLES